MNRKIEFRGFGIVEHKWFYGNLVVGNAGCYIAVADSDEDGDTITYFPIKTDTKGQFTGLRDSNGNKIYEGDIIHIAGRGFEEYDFGVVTWNKNGYFFVDDSFGKHEKSNANPIGDFFDRIKHDFNGIVITVNGNIYDNKKEV